MSDGRSKKSDLKMYGGSGIAATRLIALHINKGKTVAQCLADRTDYSQNEAKTNGGEYISTYECDAKTADEEFLLSKRQYEHITGRQQKHDIIAYQIRQSYKPGEITPEDANRIGYELAMRFTKGRHAFLVATHIDKAHIHNHIIFNSTSLDGKKKFKNFFLSGLALQKVNDILCLENGLSVIEPKPYKERTKRTVYPERKSFRNALCGDIDEILKRKPKDFEEFLAELRQRDYEYKDSRQPAVRRKGQKRFIRFRSLGEGYSVEEIRAVIEDNAEHRERAPQTRRRNNRRSDRRFDLLINIQKKIGEGKSGGYVQWAKRFNVKQASKAIVFLQEHGVRSMEELAEKTAEITDKVSTLDRQIKDAEKRLAEIAVLKTHITNYSKTKDVYDVYRKSGYSRKFFETNKEALTLHKAAKTAFDELGGKKLPKYAELTAEYAEVLKAKKEMYAEYRSARAEMKEFQLAQEIAWTFLEEEEKEQDTQSRKTENER